MKKLIIASLLIFNSSSVFADIKSIETKTVLGQILIMDAFNSVENGKGILKTPVANMESTITSSFITNPDKTCWMSCSRMRIPDLWFAFHFFDLAI